MPVPKTTLQNDSADNHSAKCQCRCRHCKMSVSTLLDKVTVSTVRLCKMSLCDKQNVGDHNGTIKRSCQQCLVNCHCKQYLHKLSVLTAKH